MLIQMIILLVKSISNYNLQYFSGIFSSNFTETTCLSEKQNLKKFEYI